MSIWSDIEDRSGGTVRKEDAFVCTKENPKVPDLDAKTSDVAIESVEIAYEELVIPN